MIAPIAALLAAACLLGAVLLLRRMGTGYRVARLLSAAPEVSLADLADLAARGETRYVRATGRISSDEEFPDENQRPLVFRRRRIERSDGRGGWTVIDEDRAAVPFGIEDRATFVAVDADALGDGLVVMPRESVGVASEIPPEVRDSLGVVLPPDAPVRLRIDQVSAVEHATVVGVPAMGTSGATVTAGLGRPLILSTLETSAAMRLLAGGRRSQAIVSAALLLAAAALAAVATVAFIAGW
jgi:hypothetical protein